MTTTKLEAIVQYFGMSEAQARGFLLDAGEDPDEVLEDSTMVVMTGETLKEFQAEGYNTAFGMSKDEAKKKGVCVNCKEAIHVGKPGDKGAYYTEAGRKEYRISGVCETCFDAMFEEPEDEEDVSA